MLPLVRMLHLTWSDRSLLAAVLLLLLFARALLHTIGFRQVRSLMLQGVERTAAYWRRHPLERVMWAVDAASRRCSATCLEQALATEALLRRAGLPAQLCIGVAKAAGDRLEAHAWVEQHGVVVVGAQEDLGRYTRLPLS